MTFKYSPDRTVLQVLIFFVLASTLFSCGGQKEDHLILRAGHSLDTQHSVHKALEYMDERLKFYSKGSLSLQIYPSGQLGSEREMIELLQIGSLSMAKVTASTLEGFVPVMKVFNLPYIFRDNEHYWRVLNGPIGKQLLNELEPYRLKGLGYFDAGSRSFYTTDTPIRSPEDLQGLKIRVMNSPTAVEMVRELGGAATPVSWGELYTALQQGVVDGAENNAPSYFLSRHYEISQFYTLDEHTSIPELILISEFVFEQLTPEQQEWLKLAMKDATVYQRKLWRQSMIDSLNAVEEAGIEIIYPDKAAFAAKVLPMHERLKGTPVGDLLDKIKAN